VASVSVEASADARLVFVGRAVAGDLASPAVFVAQCRHCHELFGLSDPYAEVVPDGDYQAHAWERHGESDVL
jgi:hypothetical protein